MRSRLSHQLFWDTPWNSIVTNYTVEFIDLMARFKAARKEDLEELLRTPIIKAIVGEYGNRIDEQLEYLANDGRITRGNFYEDL